MRFGGSEYIFPAQMGDKVLSCCLATVIMSGALVPIHHGTPVQFVGDWACFQSRATVLSEGSGLIHRSLPRTAR